MTLTTMMIPGVDCFGCSGQGRAGYQNALPKQPEADGSTAPRSACSGPAACGCVSLDTAHRAPRTWPLFRRFLDPR